jgi:hypothetical protein
MTTKRTGNGKKWQATAKATAKAAAKVAETAMGVYLPV